MRGILLLIPPAAAIIVLVIAIKSGFNKQVFMVSAGITMVINMFTIHTATWYSLICTLTIPLAAIYVVLALILSLIERRKGDPGGGEGK